MERVRNWIFLILLVVLFVEVLLIFPEHIGRQADAEKPAAPVATQGVSDQKVQGVHLVESRSGANDWELFAEAAEGSQGQGAWELRNVKVLFYNGPNVDYTVTGNEGSIDMRTKNMLIKGAVSTTSTNGYLFKTEEIRYDAGQRRMASPTAVYMKGPKDEQGDGFEVNGEGMFVEVGGSKMVIQRKVAGNKKMKDGRDLEIASESAEFSGRNQHAHFRGGVRMSFGETRIESPEALFSNAAKGRGIGSVKLTGGVKVNDAEKFATSETLNLDLIANRFVFTGRPKVYQNNDEISGEQIIFLDGGKKVKVERVRATLEENKKQ